MKRHVMKKEAHILLQSVSDNIVKNICLNEAVGEFIVDVEEHKEDEAVLLQNLNENIQGILKDFPTEFIVEFNVTENIANIENIPPPPP